MEPQTRTLDELAADEERLMENITPLGFLDERAVVLAAARPPERWVRVIEGYAKLRRAVLLAWYHHAEPWPLTGLRVLPAALERRVLDRLLPTLRGPHAPARGAFGPLEGRGAMGRYFLEFFAAVEAHKLDPSGPVRV